MLIDTHAHLDDERFDRDREEVLSRARREGVEIIINVGCDIPSSQKAIGFTRSYEGIYAVIGIHPHEAKVASPDAIERLRELLGEPGVVGVGEIGLDYHYDFSPREVQRDVFIQQMRLARELGLPVVIHDREAHGDVLDILKEETNPAVGGVLHCFSGSLEMARECIKLGFYVSIGGPVTFANARKLPEIVRALPLERLLIETDCPYLAPVPHRGERNEPAFVRLVAERIAQIRGISCEEVAAATTENAKRVFGI